MSRFQLVYRNLNVQLLKQLKIAPCSQRSIRFLRTSVNVKASNALENNTKSADFKTQANTAALRQLVKEQGDFVRKLKDAGTNDVEVKSAVEELLRRKQALLDSERGSSQDEYPFNKEKFDILMRRRFIFDQSYEIYGGASGFYDLGPVACALKTNMLHLWRRFFVLADQMHEIDCPALTISPVFKASGHIDRFSDFLVKDVVTNECFRVDHLIKSHLQRLCEKDLENKERYEQIITQLACASKHDLHDIIQEHDIKSPTTGNELSQPTEFNLMFDTQIGPSSTNKGYLRPETSQGIFVNFKRLLDYNHGRLPFAAAQIGNSFRNEIAPRSGLLRVREFTMAEIEHFFHPNDKSHPKFQAVKDIELNLYSACNQRNNESPRRMSIGEAVEKGLVANETLGYFLARIQQYLLHVGISPNWLRFRQHMSDEMAHYAVDCWDAECLTSHGWIECVGCADRSAYDLKQHTNATGISLSAERNLATPKQVSVEEIVLKKDHLKKLNNKKSKQIVKYLANLRAEQRDNILKTINEQGFIELSLDDDKSIRLEKSAIEVKTASKLVQVEEVVPNVIEPSFGIGRILYAVLEHSFRKRDGDLNSFLALRASVAAHKCSILPITRRPEFQPFIKHIASNLVDENISHKIDDVSGSIGRRYIRSDEIGIPFSITIDSDTLRTPNTVTIRDRDTKEQLRIPVDDVHNIISYLSNEKITWQQLAEKYPTFEKQQSTDS